MIVLSSNLAVSNRQISVAYMDIKKNQGSLKKMIGEPAFLYDWLTFRGRNCYAPFAMTNITLPSTLLVDSNKSSLRKLAAQGQAFFIKHVSGMTPFRGVNTHNNFS